MPDAHFIRRSTPPRFKGPRLRHYRAAVREDFRRTCAYCVLSELWAGGVENFELEHFRPKSLFPHLSSNFYNLYWSCHACNKLKRTLWPTPEMLHAGIGFVDLCASSFEEHFVDEPDGTWTAKTESARFTIEMLQLNRPHMVQLRQILRYLEL